MRGWVPSLVGGLVAAQLLGCGDLKPRCAGADAGVDGGATGATSPACTSDGDPAVAPQGSVLVVCGAETWAVKACSRSASGITRCEAACGVAEPVAATCEANGDVACADGREPVCEPYPIPDDAACKAYLEQCSADDRLDGPGPAGSAYAGCAFGRGQNFLREIRGDAFPL